MKLLLACVILTNVYGFYRKRDMKPEIPDDKLGDNHPINEDILPKFRHNNGKILTGESLFNRHRDRIKHFIGTNILPPNNNYNKGNHYYKGDNDKSIINKYKRWYRSPRFPDSKGAFPSKRIDPTRRPTFRPTDMDTPTSITSPPTLSGPTFRPTSALPTIDPSLNPTLNPSINPTGNPTNNPTFNVVTGPTSSPTNTPSNSPTLLTSIPSNAPSSSPTLLPSDTPTSLTLVPTLTPTTSPVRSCNFTGVFDLGDGIELNVCERNGEFFISTFNISFISRVARGSQIENNLNGQTLNVNELELFVGQSPCYQVTPQTLSCSLGPPVTYQYGNNTITKINNVASPPVCFESSKSFDNLTDPILIAGRPIKTALTHLLGIPTNSITGCVQLTSEFNRTSCQYQVLDQLFDNTVRVGCTFGCPQEQASIFTPTIFQGSPPLETIIFVTQWIGNNGILTGVDDLDSEIRQNSTLTCPLNVTIT